MLVNGSEVNPVKIWCEYDISGDFGVNYDQDILFFDEEFSTEEIEEEVLNILKGRTSLHDEELEGLYDWEFISAPTVVLKS